MNDAEEYCPSDQLDWRNWLAVNHQEKDGVWLILYKVKSEQHNLTWSEAVDHALCFGWIDATKRPIDGDSYKQYFTKRKPKSNWSRINKEKVEVLIEQGLMQEEGFKSIEIAKANGSWTILDAIEALEIPADLHAALTKYDGALDYFEGLSKSAKKILLHWVVSAKRPETREKRLNEVAVNAGKSLKPKQFR